MVAKQAARKVMVSKSLFVMFVVARCHNELDRRICMYRFVRVVLDLEQIE